MAGGEDFSVTAFLRNDRGRDCHPVPSCFAGFAMASDPPTFCLRWFHQLADGIKNNLELGIVLVLKGIEPFGKVF